MYTYKSIKYLGVDDDNLDLFEAQYPIPHGISYNSYLIQDEYPAVIDSVDIRRCTEWLANVRRAVRDSGRAPHYLVLQHVEPDHSGSVEAFLREYPDVNVVCTAKAAQMLEAFFEKINLRSRLVTVKDGDTLVLGRSVLRFFTAPMVHWPEVMMTYDEYNGVLFTADAFGTFSMWNSETAWDAEGRRYYTNIVGRYGPSVQSVMKKISALRFQAIAPLHGPMLTSNLEHYWKLYEKWSSYTPECDGVLVAYASIYGGTADAARQLCDMLRRKGVPNVEPFDLCRHDVSYAVGLAFKYSKLVLASVTYDTGLFPSMESFLHHLQSKHMRGRKVGFIENGSWAPTAARLMKAEVEKMRDMTVVEPTVSIVSRLRGNNINTLERLADALV